METVFGKQKEKEIIKIKYMKLACRRRLVILMLLARGWTHWITQKGGKMRYSKKASMMRNENYFEGEETIFVKPGSGRFFRCSVILTASVLPVKSTTMVKRGKQSEIFFM